LDFELDEGQRAITEAVETLLAQHAGVDRAVVLEANGACDDELAKALDESGFLEVALGEETGALEAAQLVEASAAAGAVLPVGAMALVAPQVAGRSLSGPVALVDAARPAPVRYAAHARTLLVAAGNEARIVAVEPGAAEPVRSWFGFPLGRVPSAALESGESLGAGSGERLLAWWRVALAAELAGTMRSALAVTLEYLKERRQFGRTIGSFQAVQHRLAECHVLCEGARWLAFEAAAREAPAEAAATAAAHAAVAAQRLFADTHQLSGAIGYTREHPLHVFSMRLQALRLELGGAPAHRLAAARARWVLS
jgi:alkylation response protein AidB-like acyl-CoA dehydrogenase